MTAHRTRLAVAGVGLVGARHARIAAREAHLVGLADPSPHAAAVAAELGVPLYPGIAALIDGARPEGVIVATPNPCHEADGLACLAAGVPVLIEKPIAADLAGAEVLVAAAAQAGIPLLVGHHRRHNPLIARAKAEIVAGRLGEVTGVQATCWLCKPDPYFETAWRRGTGAGPVMINLIHDVDLLMHLCGPITAAQAMASAVRRAGPVEDTAAALLHFANGALGTVSVSDTIVAPWSWELTAAENPAYPATGTFAYTIGGTLASLSVPDLMVWDSGGVRDWHAPMHGQRLEVIPEDPLVAQIRHFAEVVRGEAAPVVDGPAGLAALRVVLAIGEAARTGETVGLSD